MEKNRPVGVFDSGVGGLSVLRALEQRLPGENYLYFGDTARAPYGDRSAEEIRRFNLEIVNWLIAQDCKMLLVACNTSTVFGLDAIKTAVSIPVFGMMEAILAGTFGKGTETVGTVGFIATKGTVESGAYQKAFTYAAPKNEFYALACPDFVPLVERGLLEGVEVDQAIRQYLQPLQEKKIYTLILGCTHYPFLAPAISSFLGPDVRLVDPADSLAALVEGHLRDNDLLSDNAENHRGSRVFYCSGDVLRFQSAGQIMLSHKMEDVRRKVF